MVTLQLPFFFFPSFETFPSPFWYSILASAQVRTPKETRWHRAGSRKQITFFGVSWRIYLAEDNFWSQVLRSPTQCPSPTFYSFSKAEVRHLRTEKHQREKPTSAPHAAFCLCVVTPIELALIQTETAVLLFSLVCVLFRKLLFKSYFAYLNIALLIYEQVFGLQVSVDEVQRVKVLEGEYDLSCIKSGVVFTETWGRGRRVRHESGDHESLLARLPLDHSAWAALYLNLPIRLRCENISPPGTYSITM